MLPFSVVQDTVDGDQNQYKLLCLYLLFVYGAGNKRLLGECLLISSLPGKALRMLVDIARLAERFYMRYQSPSLVNLISKDANLVFYLSVYPLLHSSN